MASHNGKTPDEPTIAAFKSSLRGELIGPGDADYDGGENQRRDDRLDQVNENVTQEINFVPPVGSQPANQRADDKPDHDLRRQRRPIPRPTN